VHALCKFAYRPICDSLTVFEIEVACRLQLIAVMCHLDAGVPDTGIVRKQENKETFVVHSVSLFHEWG